MSMIALSEAFDTALRHYRDGKARQAEQICRNILQEQPRHAQAIHLLGVLAQQAGRHDEALTLLQHAVALRPEDADFHYNLGVIHQVLEHKDEAHNSYREAVRINRDHAGALNNLGHLALHSDQLEEAEEHLRRALQVQPEHGAAYHNLGLVCKRRGKRDEAVSCLRQAVNYCPDNAAIHFLLGQTLEECGQSDEAMEAFRQTARQSNVPNWRRLPSDEALAAFREAVRLQPDNAVYQCALGNLLTLGRQPDAALPHYEQAVRIQPDAPEHHSNLGNVLTLLDRPEEAEAHCREAIRLKSDFANGHHNLANTLAPQGRLEEALRSVENALRIEPEHPNARHCRSLWWLQQGRYAEGWPEYEWRWKLPDIVGRECREPLWDGSPLNGRTILLWAEQGLGDTIQTIRFAPLVKERGGNVVVECQAPLASLLSRCAGIDCLVPRGSPAPAADVQAPLLSLPWLLGTTLETIPADVPYVFADPDLVKHWRRELEGPARLKVGIVWQGSPTHLRDRERSIPPRHFASLARISGVQLISLQKGRDHEQLRDGKGRSCAIDLGPRLNDFADTAAVMRCLDLVITCDTSVAHLAGAMGVSVWLALMFASEWRWLMDREDSPWYPSMRIFRQPRRGDWESVFARISGELRSKVGSDAPLGVDEAVASGELTEESIEASMIAPSETFDTALRHYHGGNVQQAEQICRSLLQDQPQHALALHLLGVLAQQAGRHDEALTLLLRAVALCPNDADFHYNLGVIRQVLGHNDEARNSYGEAVRLNPDHVGALNNLGHSALHGDRLEEAEQHLRRALRVQPAHGAAYHNLGLVCKRQGKKEEAATCLRQAVKYCPDNAAIHYLLGQTLEECGKADEAIESFRQAARLEPDNPVFQFSLGNVLTFRNQPKEALPYYEQALCLQPDAPGHYSNLANVLTQLGCPQEAEARCREAIRLQPDFVNAHHNMASALAAQGRLEEAIQSSENALRIDPEHAGARHCRALWRLQQGRFTEGWAEYEWRWKLPIMGDQRSNLPRWDGSTLDGRTILLWAEQGLGDTLQAIRFVPLVKERGGTVVVECQAPLVPLLSRCEGIDRLVPRGSQAPAADVQAPLMSLPGLLGITLEKLPAEVPYLFPDPALVEQWRRELEGPTSLKIGIAWQGNPLYAGDTMRSIPLKHFTALARLPGVRLFSLQKSVGSEQVQTVSEQFYVVDLGCRLDETTGAFMDTAAVVQNLDLVVTSDTSIAHLVGGLGRPVWVALNIGCDWRFFQDRSDNPWYPTMRLFRQVRFGDWDDVFSRMADELSRRVASEKERVPLSAEDLAQLLSRALAHFQAGEREAAERTCRQLLDAEPCCAEALNLLGVLSHQAGQNTQALPSLERAVALKPHDAGFHYNLGVARHMLGQTSEAAASYRQALRFQSDHTGAFDNLGHALLALGQHAEARKLLEEAIRLRPDHADSHNRLGIVTKEQGRLDEAIIHYRKALHLAPGHAPAHHNLGLALGEMGRYDEALASYEKAAQLNPDHCEARFARAMTWLLLGDFERGWRDYEYRWQYRPSPKPSGAQPLWDGSSLNGRTILLWAEQGLGDTIQFIRYAGVVKQQGCTVVVQCPAQLTRLLSGCPGIDRLVPHDAPLPSYDVQAPLMSLPRILGTTVETVPDNAPYLFADNDLVERWRGELSRLSGFRVGIAWQGNPDHLADRDRSIPLHHFSLLAQLSGVQLISLQKGQGHGQLREVAGLFAVTDQGSRLDDFADTAAVMKCLDLVVTCDTAVAHLAGAMGVPVWLGLRFASEWRWLLKREDSPWYPSMRIFRQARRGDWEGVFTRMADELRHKIGAAAPLDLRVPVAPGELIDKITILEIKTERIRDTGKLANVRAELAELAAVRDRCLPNLTELSHLTVALKSVNEALWRVEDDLRECERAGDFGSRFVQLARSVYQQNDRRSVLKRQINERLGSRLIEEKSYAAY